MVQYVREEDSAKGLILKNVRLSLHGGYLSLIKDKLMKVFHFDIVTGPIKFMIIMMNKLKHLIGG